MNFFQTWSGWPTISQIKYWDQVNSWKIFWKFWNGLLYKNKSGPSPYSMLQYIGRVATPKLMPRNCLRYFKTTMIMGGGGLILEFMWCIVDRCYKVKCESLLHKKSNWNCYYLHIKFTRLLPSINLPFFFWCAYYACPIIAK